VLDAAAVEAWISGCPPGGSSSAGSGTITVPKRRAKARKANWRRAVAKDHHLPLVQGGAHEVDGVVIEAGGQVEAVHDGADPPGDGFDGERWVGRGDGHGGPLRGSAGRGGGVAR
jgi:hypothetical protein